MKKRSDTLMIFRLVLSIVLCLSLVILKTVSNNSFEKIKQSYNELIERQTEIAEETGQEIIDAVSSVILRFNA